MDKKTLVSEDIAGGKRLIAKLDKAGFPVSAALWYFFSDAEIWRFVIASPRVDQAGPLKTYKAIQKVLSKNGKKIGVDLSDISAWSPEHDVIKLLKIAVKTGPGISGVRFSRSTINNIYIEDAYIYRIE